MTNYNTIPKIWMLQIFANQNTQTTETSAPGNTLAPEMKTFYVKELLRAAQPNLVHAQFGKKCPIPQRGGKRLEWRRWDSFEKALTPLQEGVTPDGSKLNVRTIEQVLRQYGDYTTISDILDLTAIDPVLSEVSEQHGNNMSLTMDTVTRNELMTGQNVMYAPSVTSTGSTAHTLRSQLDKDAKLTPDLIARAAAFLKKNNAPKIDGSYVAIIHPYQEYDLMRNPEWIDVSKYQASTKIFEGEIGKLYGVRFVTTSEAAILKGGAVNGKAGNTLTIDATGAEAATGTGTTEVGVKEPIVASSGAPILTASESSPVLLNIDGVEFECVGATVAAAGSAKLKIKKPHAALTAGKTVYLGGGGKGNLAVFPCIVLGANAYGNCEVSGENAHLIIKQLGSGGTEDPLDQRATAGWKAFYAAKILMQEYMVRIEACSEMSDIADAN